MLLISQTWAITLPNQNTLSTAWAEQAALRHSYGQVSVQMEEADFAKIAAGEVVSRQSEGSQTLGLGATYLPYTPAALWLSILDTEHGSVGGGLTQTTHLPGSTDAHRINYQYMDLPWPFNDRQWVAEVSPNAAIFKASHGTFWERAWHVGPASLAPSPDPQAEWVTVNEGGWILLPVAEGSLVICGVRVELGGLILGEAGKHWATSHIADVFQRLAERAESMPEHYNAEHLAFSRPDGDIIAPGSLRP